MKIKLPFRIPATGVDSLFAFSAAGRLQANFGTRLLSAVEQVCKEAPAGGQRLVVEMSGVTAESSRGALADGPLFDIKWVTCLPAGQHRAAQEEEGK